MSFTLPTFNLVCDIYTGPRLTMVLRQSGVPCNLAIGRRMQLWSDGYQTNTSGGASPCLLVPAGTDVRDNGNASGYDVIDCPAGSGRYYAVISVDDMSKGFPTEYRLVAMAKAVRFNDPTEFAGLFWPTPIP